MVSIIIPCYNYGWLLAESLESVLAQSYTEWECIVVDDGSDDNTRAVAESYQSCDQRFRYLHQANAGMSAARNHGLRLAQGEYIQFLDADDLLAVNKLAHQVAFLLEHDKVDVVYGDVRFFRHDAALIISRSFDMQDTPWIRRVEGKGVGVVEQLTAYNDIVINAPLLRGSLLKRAGMFSESLRSVEDWEFWLRCAIQGACFAYLESGPDEVALVRVHPTSTSQNRSRMMDCTRQMREELQGELRQLGMEQALAINWKALCKILENQASTSFLQGRFRAGFTKFWQLAQRTGRYLHYLRAALYWSRQQARKATVAANALVD